MQILIEPCFQSFQHGMSIDFIITSQRHLNGCVPESISGKCSMWSPLVAESSVISPLSSSQTGELVDLDKWPVLVLTVAATINYQTIYMYFYWLPFSQRTVYRVSALVWRCFEGLAPSYLQELCCPTFDVERQSTLRSANKAELLVPRSRTATRQQQSFSVAGPVAWNSLIPVPIRIFPRGHHTSFFQQLKTFLFSQGWTGSASE